MDRSASPDPLSTLSQFAPDSCPSRLFLPPHHRLRMHGISSACAAETHADDIMTETIACRVTDQTALFGRNFLPVDDGKGKSITSCGSRRSFRVCSTHGRNGEKSETRVRVYQSEGREEPFRHPLKSLTHTSRLPLSPDCHSLIITP